MEETKAETKETPKDGATPNVAAQPARKVRQPDGSHEEPFKYISPEHEIIQHIQAFYKVSPRFPSDRYMVRNAAGEPAKAIYYTSALLRDILTENEGRGVKFVHAGVKMFMKQDAPSAEVCRWRIQSEGMPIISGYVGPERVVRLTNRETFHKLLREMFPKFVGDGWKELGEIGERARDIGMGCCILSVEPEAGDADFSERMVLPLWKSFHSLNLMLPKEDRAATLLRIFNDTNPVINKSLKESAAAQQKEKEPETAEGDAGGDDGEAAVPEKEEGSKDEVMADPAVDEAADVDAPATDAAATDAADAGETTTANGAADNGENPAADAVEGQPLVNT